MQFSSLKITKCTCYICHCYFCFIKDKGVRIELDTNAYGQRQKYLQRHRPANRPFAPITHPRVSIYGNGLSLLNIFLVYATLVSGTDLLKVDRQHIVALLLHRKDAILAVETGRVHQKPGWQRHFLHSYATRPIRQQPSATVKYNIQYKYAHVQKRSICVISDESKK